MERGLQIRYLRALGIDVWVLRRPPESGGPAAESDAESSLGDRPTDEPRGASPWVIGPGNGSLLLLCGSPEEAASPLATDIARCLNGEPVWGWPAPGRGAEGVPLEAAIRERLFTGVLVFGGAARENTPAVSGSARLLRVPAIFDLARDPHARRALWARLRATGWCAARGRGAGPV
jgi:hypothetical protein